MPTGCWCNGIAPTEDRPGFECRTALCTTCWKFLDLCVECTAWSGIPLELDVRINLSGIAARPHEEPGPAVTAMLAGESFPPELLPRSWLDVARRGADSQ